MQCFIRMFGLREGGKVADWHIYIYHTCHIDMAN